MNFENIYQCYFLGLLWGDGYMSKHPRDKTVYAGIRIETITSDSVVYETIVEKSGFNFVTSCRNRKNRKPQTRISINSIPLAQEFFKYDYHLKSHISPDKLISCPFPHYN
jgi:hypothetical protein